MWNSVNFAFNYILYFFSSGTKHSVHSPFVYDFTVNVLNKRKDKPQYHAIELIRSNLLKSDAEIDLIDFGAKSNGKKIKRKVKDIAKLSSKSAKYAELLERICHYYQPQIALELGTSLGISTLYQSIGIQNGQLITIEGNPKSSEIALYNAQILELQNIQFVTGEFDKALPHILPQLPQLDYVFFDGNHTMDATLKYFEWCLEKSHNNSIFVFDDIRWSNDMNLAWNKICNHPKVTVSIDLYAMGIVFFRQEQVKESFTLRF